MSIDLTDGKAPSTCRECRYTSPRARIRLVRVSDRGWAEAKPCQISRCELVLLSGAACVAAAPRPKARAGRKN